MCIEVFFILKGLRFAENKNFDNKETDCYYNYFAKIHNTTELCP